MSLYLSVTLLYCTVLSYCLAIVSIHTFVLRPHIVHCWSYYITTIVKLDNIIIDSIYTFFVLLYSITNVYLITKLGIANDCFVGIFKVAIFIIYEFFGGIKDLIQFHVV